MNPDTLIPQYLYVVKYERHWSGKKRPQTPVICTENKNSVLDFKTCHSFPK